MSGIGRLWRRVACPVRSGGALHRRRRVGRLVATGMQNVAVVPSLFGRDLEGDHTPARRLTKGHG